MFNFLNNQIHAYKPLAYFLLKFLQHLEVIFYYFHKKNKIKNLELPNKQIHKIYHDGGVFCVYICMCQIHVFPSVAFFITNNFSHWKLMSSLFHKSFQNHKNYTDLNHLLDLITKYFFFNLPLHAAVKLFSNSFYWKSTSLQILVLVCAVCVCHSRGFFRTCQFDQLNAWCRKNAQLKPKKNVQ